MITATVTVDNAVILYLKFIGVNNIEADIPCFIDTDFSGHLSLPQSWMTALGFPLTGVDQVRLSDGSRIEVNLHEGTVVWDGQHRNVPIHCLEDDAIVGMSLMADYLLNLPVRVNSMVTLTPLP